MIKLLAYSADIQGNQTLLRCSDNRELLANNWFDAVSFLLEPCDMAVCWNVDHLAEAFISLIPKSKAKELEDKGKIYLDNGEKIYYQMGRVFAVTYGRETNIYALHRYADKEIVDINELEKLGYQVLEAYKEFGIEPTNLSSPIGAYSQIMDRIDFPRACDLPESALSMLSKCDENKWVEWREVFKLGHWNANEVTDADLSSAYPYLISRLPDLRGAKFFEADKMPDSDDYSWGEMMGDLTLTQDITPFGYLGTKEESITTEHKWLIDKYELGEFKFKHGWFFKLPQAYRLPFKETMQNLYDKRCSQKLLVSKIAKAISVGIGGKFAQRYGTGELSTEYNSIYSRLITSRCAIKVADMIWRNGIQNEIISILVDGFLAENKGINIDLGKQQGMGSWRINPPSPFIVASLLYQWGAEKHPNNLYYSDMMKLIQNKSNASVYADIDLNLLTHGRNFPELPRTGKDLLTKHYTSEPIMV